MIVTALSELLIDMNYIFVFHIFMTELSQVNIYQLACL